MSFSLQILLKHSALLGALAIALSIVTWTMDLAGIVAVCPYCRVQRTAIGCLGALMLIPAGGNWFTTYIASVVGAYGAVNAIHMNFVGSMGPLMVGKLTKESGFEGDTFILSGAALFIIVGQVWLLIMRQRTQTAAPH